MSGRHRSGGLLRVADWFFVLRPTLLFAYWTILLAGAGLAGEAGSISLQAVFAFSMVMSGANLVNLLRDEESDRENRKLPWLAQGLFTDGAVKALSALLVVAGFVLIALLRNPPLLLVSAAVFIVPGLVYNLPPLTLKDRSYGSLVASLLVGAGLWAIGAVAVSGPERVRWAAMTGYVAAYAAVNLLAMTLDVEGDRRAGKRTMAVRFGAAWSARLAALLVAVAVADAAMRRDLVLLVPSVLTLPLFLLAGLRGGRKSIVAAMKLSVVALALSVGIAYAPVLPLAAVLYYPLARLYHRERFGMDYPSFALK